MNRQLKKRIQKALEAPPPNRQEKERFLRMLPRPRISMQRFILIQAAYLRKRTLFLSVLLLFPALLAAQYIHLDTLWSISAFMPFLGLFAVTESMRSITHGMSEFEMASRFSLKSVILARMSVLGLFDVLVLCCFIPLCRRGSHFSFLQTGLYLFVPYLLTVNISLWITRHFRGKEVIYACMSAAVLVSAANLGLHLTADFVYQYAYIKWWAALSALSIGTMIYEIYRTVKDLAAG